MGHILEQSDVACGVRFIASDPRRVKRFLKKHPSVEQLLREAKKSLQQTFGPGTTVSVAVINNPDIAPKALLVSSIHTSLSATQARMRLDTFDEAWWLNNVSRAEGQLVFTLALQ